MKILMTKTAPGSIDGIRVTQYVEGAEYDLTGTEGERDLATSFVGSGVAQEVGGSKKSAEPEPEATDVAATGDSGAATEPRKPGRKPKAG
jgi:hypothetical protein